MSELSPEDISEIRLKVVEVEFRAKSDESYLRRLRDDPLGVLKEHGFDDPMANELAAQLTGVVPEEDPALHCPKCDPFTCIVTGCCYFTTMEPREPIVA